MRRRLGAEAEDEDVPDGHRPSLRLHRPLAPLQLPRPLGHHPPCQFPPLPRPSTPSSSTPTLYPGYRIFEDKIQILEGLVVLNSVVNPALYTGFYGRVRQLCRTYPLRQLLF